MKKIRRFLSAMLISIVGISFFSMPVYADVASPSEIVSIPEFTPEINLPVASNSNMLPYSLSDPVTNTVSFSDVTAIFAYYDSAGASRLESVPVSSDGTFVFPQLVDLDRDRPMNLQVYVGSDSLPPAGKYTLSVDFISDVGITYDLGTMHVQFGRGLNNATSEYSSVDVPFASAGGSYSFSAIVSVAYSDNLSWWTEVSTIPPIGGKLFINFTSTSSDPDLTSPGSGSITDDIQQNINNTVGDISSGVSAIDDSIKELIQTISNQLTALWNQFASEFTNFYTAWENHTNSIVQAIQAISTAATDGIENIISSADKNAQDIQDNADKNTDQITNGYDNSGMTSENERLDGAISGYEDVESGIKDDVTGYIHDFDMPSWDNIFAVPGVLSAAGFIGGFMQDCFDGMGIWNIQITLSLTFIFVLMLIGYHRFRR